MKRADKISFKGITNKLLYINLYPLDFAQRYLVKTSADSTIYIYIYIVFQYRLGMGDCEIVVISIM